MKSKPKVKKPAKTGFDKSGGKAPPKGSDKKFKPWNLYERGVSWSFLDRFLRNRMECKLTYIDGYQPRHLPDFIDFGWVFHHIMETGYSSCKKPPTLQKCLEMAKSYLDKVEKEQGVVPNKDKIWEQAQQAGMVAFHYFQYYDADFEGDWEQLEQYFTYKYKYPDGVEVNINGVIDAVFLDADDERWVLDTKTKGEIDVDQILDEFPVNFQVNLYMLYMLDHKKPVDGCILNVVRRPKHRMTQADNGSYTSFIHRIGSAIQADPEHFFKRPTYKVTKQDVLDWKKRQLDPIMRDVRLWADGVTPTYTNPSGLYVMRRRSDYFDAMVYDDYSKLTKRK